MEILEMVGILMQLSTTVLSADKNDICGHKIVTVYLCVFLCCMVFM